jgi:hypothetical protein
VALEAEGAVAEVEAEVVETVTTMILMMITMVVRLEHLCTIVILFEPWHYSQFI